MPTPDRLKLPFRFDPNLLARDLASLEGTRWIRHFVQQNYEGEWSVIPLRAPADATHPVRMIYSDPTCRDFKDTPMLEACPYFQKVMGTFQCEVHAARLMRLGPGSRIKEHTDLDLDFDQGKARLHIPVVTNEHVEFFLNQTRVVLGAGECWYLRLADPHLVFNGGTTDRVHLVMDTVVNDWMRGVFEDAR